MYKKTDKENKCKHKYNCDKHCGKCNYFYGYFKYEDFGLCRNRDSKFYLKDVFSDSCCEIICGGKNEKK